jgi:hypothetical protein
MYLKAVLLFKAIIYKGPFVINSCLKDSFISLGRLKDLFCLL